LTIERRIYRVIIESRWSIASRPFHAIPWQLLLFFLKLMERMLVPTLLPMIVELVITHIDNVKQESYKEL